MKTFIKSSSCRSLPLARAFSTHVSRRVHAARLHLSFDPVLSFAPLEFLGSSRGGQDFVRLLADRLSDRFKRLFSGEPA